MKNLVNAGVFGVFIPQEEFDKGLFLNEDEKNRLIEKILENDKLIQSLKADLDLVNEGDSDEKE